MELYNTVMDWLNHEPAQGPHMRLEGGYAVVGWRDLQMNAVAAQVLTFRNMGMTMMLAIGIPVLLLV